MHRVSEQPPSVASEPAADLPRPDALVRLIGHEIDAQGWLGFERFMELALHAPGLGYYARSDRQFGSMPASGSDFVTAPELSPLFGRALAQQVAQALEATGTDEVWEFGAGTGALAAQLLQALGGRLRRYVIVDLSGALRARQRETIEALAPGHAASVEWVDRLPQEIRAVVVGNELLDAMPVALLHFDGHQWLERGVIRAGEGFGWAHRPTALRPPVDHDFAPGTVTELHRQAIAFITTLAHTLTRGAAFFIDYGFPADEYYHPQRTGGTLVCHRAHRVDADPLADVGLKDITAHVDFTGIALAGHDAGLQVLGYTSQARFLMNCGMLDLLREADPRTLAGAQKLLNEHEMGELFKVIGFARGCAFDPIGFASGDRTHRL